MRSLSTAELFAAWEQGLDQNLITRNLLILAKACEGASLNDLARLSIGERDARLLQLRQTVFGHKMHQTAACPACHEKTEWETYTSQLSVQQFDQSFTAKTYTTHHQDYHITYRLANSLDLLSIIQKKLPPEEAQNTILTGCLLEVKKMEPEVNVDNIPVSVLQAVEEEMSLQDPQADIQFDLTCPACSNQWQANFDILNFFWAEVNNWAQRLMQEIYYLARFFNWSENEILALSPRRRQLYLQMINT